MFDAKKKPANKRTNRRDFLKQLGLGGVACCASSFLTAGCQTSGSQNNTTAQKRPNVVVIVSDDHRADLMSCMNHPFIKTPHLDTLASQGINFVNGFATSGVCSPARGSILTGMYSHQCAAPRIVWNNNSFHVQETPYPARFQQHGYHTAHIGKWHLGKGHIPKPGYDHWASFEWLGEYFNTNIWTNGQKKQYEGFSDDIISQLAADYIHQQSQTAQPFCLYVGLKAPHLWFEYPPRNEHVYDGVDIPKPDSYSEDYDQSGKEMMKGNVITIEGKVGLQLFDNSWDKYIKSYYRSTMAIDDAVGRITKALDDTNLTDNTIIIYTSDQGYSNGEHGLTEKHYAYEEKMRVPMIVRYPSMIKPNQRRSEFALNIDIAPTLLDICGLPVPDEMAGYSWKPIFQMGAKPAKKWRDDFFFELCSEGRGIPGQLAVRTNDFKLIIYPEFPKYPELYDLRKDPQENQNVIDLPQYQPARAEMEKRLQRLIEKYDWKPRSVYPIPTCWALDAVPNSQLDNVRNKVLSLGFDFQNRKIKAEDKTFTWHKLTTDAANKMDVASAVGNSPDHTTFIAIPVERLIPRDTYTELRYQPYRFFKGYVNGRLYKDVSIGGHPAAAFNPPLPDKKNLIILEMTSDCPPTLALSIYSEKDSLKLPV